jgi:TPR repeat protein
VKAAVALFRLVAEAGDDSAPSAQYHLALCFLDGAELLVMLKQQSLCSAVQQMLGTPMPNASSPAVSSMALELFETPQKQLICFATQPRQVMSVPNTNLPSVSSRVSESK